MPIDYTQAKAVFGDPKKGKYIKLKDEPGQTFTAKLFKIDFANPITKNFDGNDKTYVTAYFQDTNDNGKPMDRQMDLSQAMLASFEMAGAQEGDTVRVSQRDEPGRNGGTYTAYSVEVVESSPSANPGF